MYCLSGPVADQAQNKTPRTSSRLNCYHHHKFTDEPMKHYHVHTYTQPVLLSPPASDALLARCTLALPLFSSSRRRGRMEASLATPCFCAPQPRQLSPMPMSQPPPGLCFFSRGKKGEARRAAFVKRERERENTVGKKAGFFQSNGTVLIPVSLGIFLPSPSLSLSPACFALACQRLLCLFVPGDGSAHSVRPRLSIWWAL